MKKTTSDSIKAWIDATQKKLPAKGKEQLLMYLTGPNMCISASDKAKNKLREFLIAYLISLAPKNQQKDLRAVVKGLDTAPIEF